MILEDNPNKIKYIVVYREIRNLSDFKIEK